MITRLFLLMAFVAGFSISGFAQNRGSGSVQGQIADSSSANTNLADASVSVLRTADSSSAGFSVTDRSGKFLIRDLDKGSYRIIISFQGYKNLVRRFAIDETHTQIDLGKLLLKKSADLLDEVIVERPPIEIKEDTVEYNASAFKVKPNAYAEDVLKKLPGVQVDKDGNVTAQGEQIQKVYVDGKEFFGTDPKLATKNITADMIESVQVFDDMSDQAKFTKIDDGSRQKALNIKLKKDKRNGYFGRASLGYGTDDRYAGTLSFNRFSGDQRISVVGGSNNVNQQNFNFSDIVTNMGGFGARGAGGGGNFSGAGSGRGGGYRGGNAGLSTVLGTGSNASGITQATSGGVNYVNKFGDKLQLTGSYFFSNSNTELDQSSYQQSFFPNDSSSNQTSQLQSKSLNQNQRINARLEYTIDSSTSLLEIPTLTLQHSDSKSYDTSTTQAVKGNAAYTAIDGSTGNSSLRDGISFNNNLLFRKRFKTPGRTITLGLNTSLNNSNGNGTNYSPLQFYAPDGSLDSLYIQNIHNTQQTHSANNVASVSYTEPIGAGKLLEFNYAYTNNANTSDRQAFNYDSTNEKYDEVNLQQTNYFKNTFIANRVGFNFRMAKEKYNFQVGTGFQFSRLTSYAERAVTGKDSTIRYSFVNVVPTLLFNYKFSRTQNLRISYRGHTNQPSVTQLQNVPDVTNPLQIKTGNPLLKNEFENNLNIRYNSFNPSTYKFLSVNLIFDNTYNNIVNRIDSIGHGVQLITPVNMNGTFTGSSFVTFGIPLRGRFKGSNLNFNNSINYGRNPSMLYGQVNMTTTWTVTQTAGVNLVFSDKLNLGLNGSVSFNQTEYTVQQNMNNRNLTQNYSADISYIFIKDWVLYTDFNQYITTGQSAGFNQTIPLWNASIAREIFRKRNGEIKFSVNDLLNQNKKIQRTTGDNYITDTQSNVVRRYFMLSFLYNLNRSGNTSRNNNTPRMPRSIQRDMQQMGPGNTPPAPPPGSTPVK
ncbi:MAG TPA: outer membrane beta-barrel protein [Puia sp.]|nr:outer membrane beta-barrel protein [Puia sp.]